VKHRNILRRSLAVVAVGVAALGCASITVTACNARVVDVGTNDAGSSSPSASHVDSGLVPSQYGCAEFIDDQVQTLRQGTCGGSCSATPATPYPLDSKADVIAATAGQWSYCEGTLGPVEAVGIEFTPGCRVFFLRQDANGVVVRGTEARFQASYDIYDPRPDGMPRRIDIHIDDRTTVTFDVEAFKCPEHLRLVSPDRRLELAPGFGDAGRPNPVALLEAQRACGQLL
jgi:hypothetical protein